MASGEPNFYAYVKDSNSWVDVFGLSKAYEVDTFNNLKAKDIVGDQLENHHTPQKALAKTQVSGYPQTKMAGDAPAIRLPKDEYAEITRAQRQNKLSRSKMSPEDLLKDDIDMLRKHTNAPESSIDKLKKMNKDKYKIDIGCH